MQRLAQLIYRVMLLVFTITLLIYITFFQSLKDTVWNRILFVILYSFGLPLLVGGLVNLFCKDE